jgi:hypothetical protein
MILAQVVVELRHSQPLKLFRPYEELYRSITGKELPEKEIALPGFMLNVNEKRMRVVVDPGHTSVVLGDTPNIGYCVDNIMGLFRKITELVEIPLLKRLGIRSFWYEESRLDFTSLVSAYKEIIYKPIVFIEESVDVGASFTLRDGEYSVDVRFGPMEETQLTTMFVFKPDKLPKVASYLDVDYHYLVNERKIIDAMLHHFVNAGLKSGVEQSEKLNNILLRKE